MAKWVHQLQTRSFFRIQGPKYLDYPLNLLRGINRELDCLEQSSHAHFCEVLFLGNLTLFAQEGHWTVSQVSWDSGAMETIAYTSTRIPGSCAHHSKHF